MRRTVLPAGPASCDAARSFARQTCALWSVPAEAVDAVVEVASELVANAVRFASAPVVLAVERHDGRLQVGAWDDGPGRPRLLPYRPGVSERGVGLRLVQGLSERWGSVEDQGGKSVWARLPLPDAGKASGPAASSRTA